MNAIVPVTRRPLFLIAFLVAAAASPAAFGQGDDEIVDDGPIAPRAVVPIPIGRATVQFNADQIDQWVFSRWGGSAATRDRLNANLALRIDDIDRACAVTDIQKKKLKLAGLGDIKRYYDRVEELKRKYVSGPANPNLNQNIWQEMQPLQFELNSGFFGDGSLFVKTVKSTLESDQKARYDDLINRRASERSRATIEWFVVHIDKALGLSDDQRRRMAELLAHETPPPKRYGQADFWYLMYRMTTLPEARLKAILDEAQWRLLSRQFVQARGMEPWLKSNGLIAQDSGGRLAVPAQRGVEVQIRNLVVPAAPPQPVGAIRKQQ